MERLYAVPSEKLRVWMVWLTGVGEIADEWHQWLRAHIDLIARIAEQRLQTVANNVPGGIKEIESVTNAKSEGILDNVMPRKEEKRDVSFNDEAGINDAATNDTLSAAKALSRKRVAESPEATARGESSANEDSSRTHNNPTTSGRRTGGGGEEESLATTAMADASETAWPIGTRWQPLTRCPIEKKADQMQTIQAVKEIAGRTVMTTAKFRGTGDSESTLDVAASQAAQYSMKQPESAVAQAIGGSTAATAETPMSSRIDPPTTDALGRDTVEVSIALSDDQSKVVEPSTKKETAGMELEFPSAKSDAVSPSVESEATSQPETTLKIRPTMEPIVSISPSEALLEQEAVAKRKAAEKLLGDMARAEEDIPYFFYLKAEPDMDIAIRYNDEKVIPPDLDRESISVNRRHLYFNLTDELGRDE
ncbi:uncharacterized protein LOC105258000 isoform X2 [Camponotus floridanus]|uniref:uncharacterized protein LOC105258000 isoform X2 n=1 Tax=Camponotus floridanus TaxID=104421 RepID=UPI000DC69019|nr:uncharacterized protein LOC105258000 isoform X2 [Camponotus floridanus]